MTVIRSILVHHHATIYTDLATGEMYTYSFIGRWVNELSRHFDKVGLLFHESKTKSQKHDTLLLGDRIVIESFGSPGRGWDRLQKISRVKAACKRASGKYDALLIRGITPRQYTVLNNVHVKLVAYILVGSIRDSKPTFQLSKTGLYLYFMYFVRLLELKKIAKRANLMMANSPKVVEEIKQNFTVEAIYMPTNTIKKCELRPFRNKVIGNPIRFYFCGRVVKDKGIFELLEAVSILNEKGINCRATITGIVSADVQAEFQSLPYWHVIKDLVEFTGFVYFGEDLLNLYESQDIFVLPSYHEGFPHSIWEAAAVSTPVITTPVGGIPGILTNEEVWFVSVKSARALAEKVIELIQNPDLVNVRTRALYSLLQKNTVESGVEKLAYSLKNCTIESE